jgi:hypothetical protein
MTEQPDRQWTDDQVQDILRRFAATRETLGNILTLINENMKSEVAYALISQADSTNVDTCALCEGKGITGGVRCPNCAGIGRLLRPEGA